MLLLTSRPYGVQSERRLVDLVVEHKGLNPEQVRNFAGHLLSCSKVAALTQGSQDPHENCGTFLMLLDKVTILKQVARIPVVLRVLLLVWQ